MFSHDYYNISLDDFKTDLLHYLKSYKLLHETRLMLVLADDEKGNKISIFPSCRVFIHGDIDEEEAKGILNGISNSIIQVLTS